jgi:hypothetical protein
MELKGIEARHCHLTWFEQVYQDDLDDLAVQIHNWVWNKAKSCARGQIKILTKSEKPPGGSRDGIFCQSLGE